MIDETPTILIIDDDPSVRRGLSRLIQAAGMKVKMYESAQDFLSQPPHDGHGCILLDVSMPGLTGLELQRKLLEVTNTLPIVFISGEAEVPEVAVAMRNGAVDFLTKPIDRDHLFKALSESLAKEKQQRELKTLQTEIRENLSLLTHREYSILEHVISGMLNKHIAHKLGITEDTVKVHRGRVMKKMGADSLATLVRFAELVAVEPVQVAKM